MKRFILLGLIFLAGCASQPPVNNLEAAIEDSRRSFNAAIPADWNIDNYSNRVVDDYISKGGNGFVATDVTGKISSFYLIKQNKPTENDIQFASNEAKGQCENTVALAVVYGFIPNQPTECRVVMYKNKIISKETFIYNGVEYFRGDTLY